MNYEVIIDGALKRFRDNNGFINADDNTIFELFVNSLIAKKYRVLDFSFSGENFSVSNVGGGDDSGIDGIFISVNNKIVFSKEDIDDVMKNASELNVEFVFIQSKNKTNIDTGEMGKFFSGIKNFIRDEQIDQVNSKIADLIELKNYIFSSDLVVLISKKPSIRSLYFYKGKNIKDEHVQAKIKEFLHDINDGFDYDIKDVEIYDGEKMFELIRDVENKVDVTIEYRDSFELLDTQKVDSSLVVLCSAKSLLELLIDENNVFRSELFKDNIRDYQGETTANREIYATAKDNPSEFCLLNNGITIVCGKCFTNNRKITFTDPQIVNGCQTCSTIYKVYQENIDVSNINVIVKVIATNDINVIGDIIKGTNTQNVVYNESFEIMKKFHKDFEEYVKAHQLSIKEDDRIFYERRSNQYNNISTISRTQTFNFRVLIQSYVSTFLLAPNRGFEHEVNLLDKYDGQIFNEEDNMYPYFVAALLYLKIEKLFKEHYDEYRYHNKYRCLIMSIFVHVVGGRIPKMSNSKTLDNYCKKIETVILNSEIFREKIDESISEFDSITNDWIVEKGPKYYHMIKDNAAFVDFMLRKLGFIYENVNDKNDETILSGYVTTVKKDRNGLFYCYISADPVDVYAHEDDCPKTRFNSLVGKKVKYKIISYSKYSNPRGKILNVYSKTS